MSPCGEGPGDRKGGPSLALAGVFLVELVLVCLLPTPVNGKASEADAKEE